MQACSESDLEPCDTTILLDVFIQNRGRIIDSDNASCRLLYVQRRLVRFIDVLEDITSGRMIRLESKTAAYLVRELCQLRAILSDQLSVLVRLQWP